MCDGVNVFCCTDVWNLTQQYELIMTSFIISGVLLKFDLL